MTDNKVEEQDRKSEICTSIFKNGCLTKEAYTWVWIELIQTLEDRKGAGT